MSWFARLCRNTGLMIHHATHPAKKKTQIVRHETQEKQVNETTTLRRTTIEEIEVTPAPGSKNQDV